MWTWIQNLRRSKQPHDVNTSNYTDFHMIYLHLRISHVNSVDMNSEIKVIETTTCYEDIKLSNVTIVEAKP